jgi:hypothetical protein
MRTRLGESLATIQEHSTPLEEATWVQTYPRDWQGWAVLAGWGHWAWANTKRGFKQGKSPSAESGQLIPVRCGPALYFPGLVRGCRRCPAAGGGAQTENPRNADHSYLEAHQGREAVAEFQNILDHRGIVFADSVGALAHLQLGRAYVVAGDITKSKKAYQDFLTLWKDADANIPVLNQAKAEYAKLR